MGSAGLLFVNSTYAENTLHLGDPKLPIGLDGKGPDDPPVPPDPGPPQPPGPPSPPPPARKKMQRISISLANPDKILEQVLDKIDGEARVVGAFSEDKERPTVCSVVDRRRKAGLPVAIDLIAHASQGILQFGSWKIHGDDQTCITLREEWRQRTPSEIRLLGCSTASVPAGRAAMKYLKNVFGQVQSNIRVYGTTNALLAMDFGPEGFLSTELLVEVDDPPTPPLSQAEVVARWFGRFPKLSGSRNSLRTSLAKEMRNDAITRSIGPVIEHDESADMAVGKGGLESLFDQLGDNLYSAPGLLAVPDVERLYPVKSGNGTPRFHRVSSFLGGAFVRVYTEDLPDGVLLRRGDATF